MPLPCPLVVWVMGSGVMFVCAVVVSPREERMWSSVVVMVS